MCTYNNVTDTICCKSWAIMKSESKYMPLKQPQKYNLVLNIVWAQRVTCAHSKCVIFKEDLKLFLWQVNFASYWIVVGDVLLSISWYQSHFCIKVLPMGPGEKQKNKQTKKSTVKADSGQGGAMLTRGEGKKGSADTTMSLYQPKTEIMWQTHRECTPQDWQIWKTLIWNNMQDRAKKMGWMGMTEFQVVFCSNELKYAYGNKVWRMFRELTLNPGITWLRVLLLWQWNM